MLAINLNENAKIINPSTTLTVFIHPPDLGNPFNIRGNIANKVNGKAKANPKPNIPIRGSKISPAAAFTSNAPTMGPVQLNETITKVKAIKNEARNPPLSTCRSDLFANPEGKTISNIPKNEAANAINNAKKIVLGIQWVLSVVVKSAPALVSETIKPTLVYKTTIEIPKIKALTMELNLEDCPCIKNDTVIGIIGKTHGVSTPAKPRTNARKNIPHIELIFSGLLISSKSTCGDKSSSDLAKVASVSVITPLTLI